MTIGIVKWYNSDLGYGFIVSPNTGKRFLFTNKTILKIPAEIGQIVDFDVGQTRNNIDCAVNIRSGYQEKMDELRPPHLLIPNKL
jgi:cold shock CspA family protein